MRAIAHVTGELSSGINRQVLQLYCKENKITLIVCRKFPKNCTTNILLSKFVQPVHSFKVDLSRYLGVVKMILQKKLAIDYLGKIVKMTDQKKIKNISNTNLMNANFNTE